MISETVVEVAIGCALVPSGAILLAFSKITYRFIDATAGRTAEKCARAGADGSWRMYPWQRPLLRWLMPSFTIVLGIAFIVDGLS